MKNILLTVFHLLFILHCSAQSGDTLNKTNAQGKLDGYWETMLDDRADPVDSMKDAYFIGYSLWDNGKPVFIFNKHVRPGSQFKYSDTLPEKGKPVVLHGTFTWYNDYGMMVCEEIYANGSPVTIRSFTRCAYTYADPCQFEVLDFTKHLDGIRGTFYYEEWKSDGTLGKRYWFRKGKRGWRVYRIKG